MAKVMWYAQEAPAQRQIAELRSIFGAETVVEHIFIPSAERLADHYKRSGADDLVLVGPLAMLEVVCALNIKPLWAAMDRAQQGEEADVTTPDGRHYRFNRFLRVVEFRLDYFEELEVLPGEGAEVLWIAKFSPRSDTWKVFRGLYGETAQIHRISRPLEQPQVVADIFAERRSRDLAMVAPIPFFDILIRRGIYPIRVKLENERQTLRRVRVVVDRKQAVG